MQLSFIVEEITRSTIKSKQNLASLTEDALSDFKYIQETVFYELEILEMHEIDLYSRFTTLVHVHPFLPLSI